MIVSSTRTGTAYRTTPTVLYHDVAAIPTVPRSLIRKSISIYARVHTSAKRDMRHATTIFQVNKSAGSTTTLFYKLEGTTPEL